ncbi:MAG: hypothetical protein IJO46_06440 [Thermoguttaceae bacterium]|nr:hypothetical protein [Thermoguttaceae bacterium]
MRFLTARIGKRAETGGAGIGKRAETGGARIGKRAETGGARIGKRAETGGASRWSWRRRRERRVKTLTSTQGGEIRAAGVGDKKTRSTGKRRTRLSWEFDGRAGFEVGLSVEKRRRAKIDAT